MRRASGPDRPGVVGRVDAGRGGAPGGACAKGVTMGMRKILETGLVICAAVAVLLGATGAQAMPMVPMPAASFTWSFWVQWNTLPTGGDAMADLFQRIGGSPSMTTIYLNVDSAGVLSLNLDE